jgi:hypothetical protein
MLRERAVVVIQLLVSGSEASVRFLFIDTDLRRTP